MVQIDLIRFQRARVQKPHAHLTVKVVAALAFIGVALLSVLDPNGFLADPALTSDSRIATVAVLGVALLLAVLTLTLGGLPARKDVRKLEVAARRGQPGAVFAYELAQAHEEAKLFGWRTAALFVSYLATLGAGAVVVSLGIAAAS